MTELAVALPDFVRDQGTRLDNEAHVSVACCRASGPNRLMEICVRPAVWPFSTAELTTIEACSSWFPSVRRRPD